MNIRAGADVGASADVALVAGAGMSVGESVGVIAGMIAGTGLRSGMRATTATATFMGTGANVNERVGGSVGASGTTGTDSGAVPGTSAGAAVAGHLLCISLSSHQKLLFCFCSDFFDFVSFSAMRWRFECSFCHLTGMQCLNDGSMAVRHKPINLCFSSRAEVEASVSEKLESPKSSLELIHEETKNNVP